MNFISLPNVPKESNYEKNFQGTYQLFPLLRSVFLQHTLKKRAETLNLYAFLKTIEIISIALEMLFQQGAGIKQPLVVENGAKLFDHVIEKKLDFKTPHFLFKIFTEIILQQLDQLLLFFFGKRDVTHFNACQRSARDPNDDPDRFL
nr:hypothetical protein [uncultured Cohaesibacter sp.]